MQFEKLDDYRWLIPQQKGMRVPGLIYASKEMLETIAKDNAVDQVMNVAWLPGVVGSSMAMPDIHWGYGFPIGSIANVIVVAQAARFGVKISWKDHLRAGLPVALATLILAAGWLYLIS